MDTKIEQVLVRIAQALNVSRILWGVGGSLLLRQYGLTDTCRDIDLLVAVADAQTADSILSAMGEKLPPQRSDMYATDYFCEYIIDGVSIDLIAGLKIRTGKTVFEYVFNTASVPHTFLFGDVPVPFSTLEEWHTLYQLMPGKTHKVQLIAAYFRRHGVEYPHLLRSPK
ncbi:MAG: nucleotidyltransferase family protein [Prevotella sp.]|nr:nucleotidyltransferase family protein [Prevotella sp.]